MVKRSSSKRAYKKRGTVRKSRVIRRRKTTQSKRKTQRGAGPKEMREEVKRIAGTGRDFASDTFNNAKTRFGFGTSSVPSPDQEFERLGPSTAENVDANPKEQQAAAAEENKAALKNAYDEAFAAYNAAKQNRDEVKKNFRNGPKVGEANADASAAYQAAFDAARAAAAGGVEGVIYP